MAKKNSSSSSEESQIGDDDDRTSSTNGHGKAKLKSRVLSKDEKSEMLQLSSEISDILDAARKRGKKIAKSIGDEKARKEVMHHHLTRG